MSSEREGDRRTGSQRDANANDNTSSSRSNKLSSRFSELSLDSRKDAALLGTKSTITADGITYAKQRVVGHGSFGVVYQATIENEYTDKEGREYKPGDKVAIKKVLQDKRFKNRELQIMKMLNHPNVVTLINHFYTNGDRADEVYLNLVLEYVPDTVYRIARYYSKLKHPIPIIYVKLYVYQLLRSLAYIHQMGICHRDIKPQNLLLDPQTSILKLCDFGSAKVLVKGEPNVSYICSRYYRAPELIFGATHYSTAIDVWSMGCVMAELLLGQPLFPGESGVDQLVEIIKVLGTPTRAQILAMNQHYTEYKFPQIKPHPWQKVFRSLAPPEAIDLLSKLLQYDPTVRFTPLEACAHPFFDELRDPEMRLPNGRPLPPLFNFTPAELEAAGEFAPLLYPRSAEPVSSPESSSSSASSSSSPTAASASVSSTSSTVSSSESSRLPSTETATK
mmetsp:Transcript_2729/g.6608  ORF Transcript_2729/g.6608 Transcript_2729/m.6608 type:complete len:449 (-) Transcript_2729:83-1429(-)